MQDLRRLAAFGRALAHPLAPSKVIGLLAQRLEERYPACELAIALYEDNSHRPRIVHTTGPFASRAIEETASGMARATESITSADGTMILVPLYSDAGARGVVSLATDRSFGAPERDVLEAMVACAGVALGRHEPAARADHGGTLWESALDSISLALCTVTPDGTITGANQAFAELVELERGELPGSLFIECFPPPWRTILQPMLRSDWDGDPQALEDERRSLCARAFRLGGTAGVGRVLVFDDRSDRRQLQEQLIQSEKMSAIGQLIAGVAHDLNNPLASVVGFADYLMENSKLPDAYREPLKVIQQEAERAANIVRNLLNFARKQEGRRRLTDVPRLLENTIDLMRNEVAAHKVDLLLETDPVLPELDIEPNQVQQVLVNLITNACQAIAGADRPGRILVRARCWTDGVAIDVSDNGPGIPREHQAKVFEPFFTTKAEGRGTGLGLSISQGIVKEHGGRVVLVGSGPQGTVFRMELPGSGLKSSSRPTPASIAAVDSRRILVVDDEPHILHYMRATLESWGHEVEIVPSGAAALERVARDQFDVIITDLRMPALGGREFYRTLQRERPEAAARVVFSTGDTLRGDTLAFLEAEGRPFLHKPFSLKELRQILTIQD